MLGRPQVIFFFYTSPSCIYLTIRRTFGVKRAVKIKTGNSAESQCHGRRTEQV